MLSIKREEPLIIALARGRILKSALPFLEMLKIKPKQSLSTSRRLLFNTNKEDIDLLILRSADIPPYLERGVAHVAIVGKDTLLEHDSKLLCEPVDLGFAKCKLMTAVPIGKNLPKNGRIKVATKYVSIARKYFGSLGRQIDLVHLNGSMELAPIVGLSDVIVDVVNTGKTLKENGLEARDIVAYSSARLATSRVAMKTRASQIKPLIELSSRYSDYAGLK